MPRRRVLTDAQLESLLALPMAEVDLVRHDTLSRADLAAIDRRRRGRNRLGFALQLCAFRYPGRLLRPAEAIPEEALRFIGEQIGVDAVETITAYAARAETRREQLEGACRKVREQAGRRADWLGLQAGLPSYGRCEMRPRPAHLTAIFKLCDRSPLASPQAAQDRHPRGLQYDRTAQNGTFE